MKYLVLCFKMPYPLHLDRAASSYSSAHGEQSHNHQHNPVYQRLRTWKDPQNVSHSVSQLLLANYKNKLLRSLIPAGCEVILKESEWKWPFDHGKFTIVNNPSLGVAEHATLTVNEKSAQVPEEISFILDGTNPTIDFVDLANGYEGECCYVYKALKYQVGVFGATIIEPLVGMIYKSIYKTNYANMIKSREKWENLSDAEVERLKRGEIEVEVADVHE